MKTILLAAMSAAFLLALSVSPCRAQDIEELQKRFDRVKKIVDDPLTDEAGIRKAIRDLEQLVKLSQEFDEVELRPGNPTSALAGGVVETLRHLKSRLPAGLNPRVERRPGFPVPQFEGTELLAALASELDQSQLNLARHLRKGKPPEEIEAEKLLFEVSRAQENLAWEAGWPFTKTEAELVRSGGRSMAKAYESRLLRGIERVNQRIGLEHDANGRDQERPFVLHLSASDEGKKRFAKHLKEVRQVGELPSDGTRKFDGKEAEILRGAPPGKTR